MILEQIQETLRKKLAIDHMEVIDESAAHCTPKGVVSHVKLILVSPNFHQMGKVQRHKLIYTALSEEMNEIHALALSLYAPDEWQNQSKPSPKCLGGAL